MIKHLLLTFLLSLSAVNVADASLFWRTSSVGGVYGSSASPSGALSDFCGQHSDCQSTVLQSCRSYEGQYCDSYYAYWVAESNPTAHQNFIVFDDVGVCPPGSYDDGGGVCIDGDPCTQTQGQSISWLSATGTDGCVDGCTTGGVTACFNIPKIVNGVTTAEYHCSSDYSSTGTSCTGGGDTQTQPLIETCAAGQIAGDFNGSFQCVDNTTGQVVDTAPTVTETATSNTTSNTVDNGDGTTTTTTTTTTTNADGSTSTTIKTETKNASGQVTSSGTITDSQLKDSDGDGTADGNGEGEGEGEDTESTFAASACGTAPACEGDAIQCAIATQQHEANCLITGDGSPITTEALLGAGEATTLQVDPSDQYDISGMLDTTSFVAGTCPAPRTISVNGQNMTIDYTELCNLADILGYLVMFTASIISLRIIGGAF